MGSRRASGEGAIYRTTDGRYYRATVDIGWRDGKRRRKYLQARTRAEVARKLRDAIALKEAGALTAGQAPTVEQWLRHWLEVVAARRVKPRTLDSYESYCELYLVPALGRTRLDRLQPEQIERMYADMAHAGLSGGTILKAHRILSVSLRVAMQRGRVGRNACDLVDPPSYERREVAPLSRADARRLLEAAREQRNAARWSVALSLGLRQGEALGLRWDAVDTETGQLRVRAQLQRRRWRHGCDHPAKCGRPHLCPQRTGGGLVLDEPKSRAGRRTIPLPGPLAAELREHRQSQLQERMAAGPAWREHGLVFAQVDGAPIDPKADWTAWSRLLDRAGVPAARLHDARHTAATLLLERGVDVRVVQDILGHSSSTLTRDTYQHVTAELERRAAEHMGDALWGDDEASAAGRRSRLQG